MTGHTGEESLAEALKGAELVIVPAGVPRKPGMTRDDLFNINAGIVKNLAEAIAKYAPGVSCWMHAKLRLLQAVQLLFHASRSMSWLSRTLWWLWLGAIAALYAGHCEHHLEPCQLDGAHCGRGLQGGRHL